MKIKTEQYREVHRLPVNNYLIFYGYIILSLIAANIFPVPAAGYTVFFLAGLAGITLLFIKASFMVSVRNNRLEVSVKLVARVTLLRLHVTGIENISQLTAAGMRTFKIVREELGASFPVTAPTAIKVTMRGNKSYIISTDHPEQLINMLRSVNRKISYINKF